MSFISKYFRRPLLNGLSACLCCVFIGVSISVYAADAYVTDDFEIMFREGPSIQNRIIRPLRSGTAIEVVIEDAGNGHSQVRTERGEVGYMLSRFVSELPSARSQVQSLQSQVELLSEDPNGVASRLLRSEEENQLLIQDNMRLATELSEAQQQLEQLNESSGGVVELSEQNQALNTEVRQLLLQLDDFRMQNDTLRDASEKRTLLIGGSLVFLGLFLGWLLSKAGGRRSSASDW